MQDEERKPLERAGWMSFAGTGKWSFKRKAAETQSRKKAGIVKSPLGNFPAIASTATVRERCRRPWLRTPLPDGRGARATNMLKAVSSCKVT